MSWGAAETEALIRAYYACFFSAEARDVLALLAPEVLHEFNQGEPERGQAAFATFLEKKRRNYHERVDEICVFTEAGGTRAAAEFTLTGTYVTTYPGLPEARGQGYQLRVGAFFEICGGLISRISTHFNFREWLRQVERGGAVADPSPSKSRS